ncbi:MAG: endonuclease/exonuclease/phosphatase [Chitinophagales bacterium]
MKKSYIIAMLLLVTAGLCAQETKQYKVGLIGFYNLENFYDTIDQPFVDDAEFLPKSERHYNTEVYRDKVGRLAEVLSGIGKDITPDGLSCFGVAEIENDNVLNDLVAHPKLKPSNFKIVHYDSPDSRGVDVAFLYNPKYMTVLQSRPLHVTLPVERGDSFPHQTRDVLWVTVRYMLSDTIHIFVNHWPSRRGGEEASRPLREIAAGVSRKIIDSLMVLNPETKAVVMGDLNDDPSNTSCAKIIGAKADKEKVQPGGMFNPFWNYYKKGIGTLAYNDSWDLFDQIMISHGFLPKEQNGVFYQKALIYNRDFMVQKTGKFKGYPLRTWDGNIYNHGYSDHFPTYIVLLKAVQ